LCLETALENVQFPSGPEDLDLEVRVQWSDGLLNLVPIVVGHHIASHINVDPDRGVDVEAAKAKLRVLQRRRDELVWPLGEITRERSHRDCAPNAANPTTRQRVIPTCKHCNARSPR